MRKKAVISLSILLAGTAVASSMMSSYYQSEHAKAVSELNQDLFLQNMRMQCSTETRWFGVSLEETCTLERLGDPLVLLEVWHKVFITPVWSQGKFGITPNKGFFIEFFDLNPLVATQEGKWYFSLPSLSIAYSYTTGALHSTSMPDSELQLDPITLSGRTKVIEPFKTQASLNIPKIDLTQPFQTIKVSGFKVETQSNLMNSTPFIEHSSVSLNSLSFSTGIDTARFEGLSIVQENALKNGRLDTSNKIELSSFHHKKEDGSLSFNDNKLHLSFTGVDWNGLQEINNQVSLDDPAVAEDLQVLLAKGLTFNLDTLESNFRSLASSGTIAGPSGALTLNGQATLNAVDPQKQDNSIDNRLNAQFLLELSDELLVGPQAGMMQDFIEQGWLIPNGNMLTASIQFKDGFLLANDEIVSSLAMIPESLESH